MIQNPILLSSPSSTQAQFDFEEGLRFLQAGRLEEAEVKIKKALEFEADNPQYHFELANVYALRYDDALEDRDNVLARMILNGARRELEQALSIHPDFIPAQYNLGVIYKKQGRFVDSREAFKKVLEMDSNQVGAWMQIGATYEEQGFYDEAKDVYLKARELYFNHPDIQEAIENLSERKRLGKIKSDQEYILSRGRQIPVGGTIGYDPRQRVSGAQTLPYLSAWLVQQLMKAKRR